MDEAPFVDDASPPPRLGRGGRRDPMTDSFPAGSLVRHPTFGVGRVEQVNARAAGSSARVSFATVGTKTLVLEYAKLERIG